MQYLKLTLSGVLQSYGTEETGWVEFRGTETIPTASAVVGMIACAMGLRIDDEVYKRLSDLDILYVTNGTTQKLLDYQIISPREYKKEVKDSRFWCIDGSRTGKQIPIHKEYLMDASFTVYIGSENTELLQDIHYHLRHPVWTYYLGRKCCTPSSPLVPAEFELCTEDEVKEKGAMHVLVCRDF